MPEPATLAEQEGVLASYLDAAVSDSGYMFGIFTVTDDRLVGQIGVTNIVRRAWQNGIVGYFVAENENGKGYATEAVRLVTQLAFERLGLHRLQAAVVPSNAASIRVMEKAGFRHEGFAPNYLQIAGRWADHNLYAFTLEDYLEQRDQPR